MNWILEQPLPILALGIVMECILFAGFWNTGNPTILWGMAAVFLITGGLLALEYTVETEFEQVETTIHRLARAVEEKDTTTLFAHISPRAPELQKRASNYIAHFKITRVDVKSNLKVKFNNRINPPSAIARFNVVAEGSDEAGLFESRRYAATLEINFRRENNQWNATEVVEMSPLEGMKADHHERR